MKLLVTRPREDAATLIEAARARGLEPVLEPLLRIRFHADAAPALAGVQALLFTSANGVRAFAASSAERRLPALAVGDATARAAGAAGFAAVASAGGDVESLVRLVVARHAPDAGALLHAAGREVAGDLAGRLADAGFTMRRAVLYSAEAATELTAPTRAALNAGLLDLALFFSPRTAATFARLAAADFPARGDGPVALCLSQAVAAALAGPSWRGLRVAAAPTQAALLAALDDVLAERRQAAGPSKGQEQAR